MKPQVICRKRTFIVSPRVNPYLYQFPNDTKVGPPKFLAIVSTIIYEFGGTHDEALKSLSDAGYDVVYGEDVV